MQYGYLKNFTSKLAQMFNNEIQLSQEQSPILHKANVRGCAASKVKAIFKEIKKLSVDEQDELRDMLVRSLSEDLYKPSNIKHCQFCGCKLLMKIEKEHKTCWDCHYEGRDVA